MDRFSAVLQLLLGMLHIDRSQISVARGLRNAIGVVTPLVIGILAGQGTAGLIVSIGALNVAFLDLPGPYSVRLGRMLAGGLIGGFSVFIGSSTGSIGWLTVLLAAAWGFGAGLLVIFGPAIAQIGMTGTILLLVYGGFPAPPVQAALLGLLVLAGSAFQALLAITAWPFRRESLERDALRAVFQQLAAYAGSPSEPGAPPPATPEITAASLLIGRRPGRNAVGEQFRAMLAGAERIRLELMALRAGPSVPGHDLDAYQASRPVEQAVRAAGEILAAVATAIGSGHPASVPEDVQCCLHDAIVAVRDGSDEQPDEAGRFRAPQVLSHLEVLADQVDGVLKAIEGSAGEGVREAAQSIVPAENDYLDMLHANLTPRSSAFRHALRLGVGLAIATALAHSVDLYRGYWVALTVAVVLKPDFGATFTRGIGRIIGTLLGLAVATGLVYVAFGSIAARVILVGVLTFAVRAAGAANFSLTAIGVTALVVVLISFVGARPETIILARGLDTLIGGVLSLVGYALWPTWEQNQTPDRLADMLDAYRRYFDMVAARYLDAEMEDRAQLSAARLAARLARTNAEDSLGRLRAEPARGAGGLLDIAERVFTASHRFISSTMVLEAGPLARMHGDRRAWQVFAGDVDTTIDRLSAHLRNPTESLGPLPDLQADQHALDGAGSDREWETGSHSDELRTVGRETSCIADSLVTMTSAVKDG